MADRKSTPLASSASSSLPKVQHELIECIDIVKSEITNVLKILQDYINENSENVNVEQLKVLLRKLKTITLLSRGVQDYIFEIDAPETPVINPPLSQVKWHLFLVFIVLYVCIF